MSGDPEHDPRGTTSEEPDGGIRVVYLKHLFWPRPELVPQAERPRRRGRSPGQIPPYSYRITLGFAVLGGRMECVRFEIASAPHRPEEHDEPLPLPVTARTIRAVPLRALIEEELFEQAKALRRWESEGVPTERGLRELAVRRAAAEASLGRAPGRPPLYTEDHFRAVADLYTRAWDLRRRPTKAVAAKWQVSSSTAAKWVARARAMGLLPPTGRGRPRGGLPQGAKVPTSRASRSGRKLREIEALERQEALAREVVRQHEEWLDAITGRAGARTGEEGKAAPVRRAVRAGATKKQAGPRRRDPG